MQEYLYPKEVFPGVHHIRDAMGVHCTLLVGSDAALLFDTGYGLYDLPGMISRITRLPLRVICSHGHHDHACGNAQFKEVWMPDAERPVLTHYTRPEQRLHVLEQAAEKGVLPASFDRAAYLSKGFGVMRTLEAGRMDLGNIPVEVLMLPGHTPGSVGLYVPRHRLLLIGDNWNPTTWLFFPECAPMRRYIQSMRDLLALPIRHVLSSHEASVVPAARLFAYVEGLRDDTFARAVKAKVPPYETTDIYACYPEPGTTLYYDRRKL